MLSIRDTSLGLCDHLPRRELLRAGSLALLGWGGTAYQQRLRADTAAAGATPGKAKACIVLFLMGGPPQHSTWDPKPDAPEEVRGEFAPIATTVPGLQVCELLPNTARLAEHIALLRAVVTDDNAHSSSGYWMLTGQPHSPLNQENANPGPPNDWPTLGSVVQHLNSGPRFLPAAVRLPHHIFNTDQSVWPGQDSGFLGHAADPWLFRCEPASPGYDVPDFRLAADVSLGRLENRRSLLTQLESKLAAVERNGTLAAYDDRRQQAFNLLSTPEARAACDLGREPEEVRARYGAGQFGQSVLLARRLVEAGVSFVQVNWFRGADEPSDAPCWDSHARESDRLKTVLAPPFDLAYSALLEDLKQRGMLEETLVVCTSEFGRTPRFNGRGGRDHWGHCFSVAMAGGGIRGGQAYGASDPNGAYPREGKVLPQDVTATIFHSLGYDPGMEIHDPLGRPLPISRGQIIRPLL